jgi:hypothetical protein
MNTMNQLNDDIEATITIIKTKYPELVKYLDELPITIPNESNPKIDTKLLSDYLDSLQNLINKYAVNHKKTLEIIS